MKKAAEIAQAEDFILKKEDQYQDAIAQGEAMFQEDRSSVFRLPEHCEKSRDLYF